MSTVSKVHLIKSPKTKNFHKRCFPYFYLLSELLKVTSSQQAKQIDTITWMLNSKYKNAESLPRIYISNNKLMSAAKFRNQSRSSYYQSQTPNKIQIQSQISGSLQGIKDQFKLSRCQTAFTLKQYDSLSIQDGITVLKIDDSESMKPFRDYIKYESETKMITPQIVKRLRTENLSKRYNN